MKWRLAWLLAQPPAFSLTDLQQWFERNAGHARLEGARWARRHSDNVKSLLIWEAVEAEPEENSALQPEVWQIHPEARWDPQCLSGRYFREGIGPDLSNNPTFQRGIVWDAFLFYRPQARWASHPPPVALALRKEANT